MIQKPFNKNGPEEEAVDGIFIRLRRGVEELTAMQQVVCTYMLENYRKVPFITVEELAMRCGASSATVVRTVKAIGYGSYREMQSEFEKLLVGINVSLWWELERSWEETSDGFPLHWIAKDNIKAIQDSVTPQLMEAYPRAISMLLSAERIYIVGMRSSQAAAIFFYSMLNQVRSNVTYAAGGADVLYDDLVDLGANDLLFFISLGGPHHAKSTTNALTFATQNGIPSIVVANSPATPAVEKATIALYVPSAERHYSIVTCMTLLESLVVSIGQKDKERAQCKLRKLEQILMDKNITF